MGTAMDTRAKQVRCLRDWEWKLALGIISFNFYFVQLQLTLNMILVSGVQHSG